MRLTLITPLLVVLPDSNTLRWTLEGADAARFALTDTIVNFKSDFTPNFEKPGDADKDNVYEVTVVVPVTDSVQPGKRKRQGHGDGR